MGREVRKAREGKGKGEEKGKVRRGVRKGGEIKGL